MSWLMKTRFTRKIANETRNHKRIVLGLAGFAGLLVIVQVYFLQELLAAEVLFMLAFTLLLVICGSLYLIGTIGERGIQLAEAKAHVLLDRAKHRQN